MAVPAMRLWLGKALPEGEIWPDDEAAWAKVTHRDFDALSAAFWAVRNEQIEMIAQFSTAEWETLKDTFWGDKPLSMVVTKTFQHTYEHGDTLLRIGLWWDE